MQFITMEEPSVIDIIFHGVKLAVKCISQSLV